SVAGMFHYMLGKVLLGRKNLIIMAHVSQTLTFYTHQYKEKYA
ncbi:hypothetical protein LCGC14_2652010, partial [marine sediment metagenome]